MATKQAAVELGEVHTGAQPPPPPRLPFTSSPASTTLLRTDSVMRDLTNPQLIKAKGIMFFAIGIAAATLLILEQPTLRIGLLLAISIWCFCRAYYFAFYV